MKILFCSVLFFSFALLSNAETELPTHRYDESVKVVDLHHVFNMPVGAKGLEFDDKFKHLNNQYVQITGFIVKSDEPALGKFLLSLRPIQLNEHADGEANDLPPSTVHVFLDPTESESLIPYKAGLQTFRGVLNLGRFEGIDQSIYWIRLQLPPIKN